jgi:uncharacterized protein YjbJ (UPF0337 family)
LRAEGAAQQVKGKGQDALGAADRKLRKIAKGL